MHDDFRQFNDFQHLLSTHGSIVAPLGDNEVGYVMKSKTLPYFSTMMIPRVVGSTAIKEAEKAARIYDILEAQGQMVDDNDILIAGIMISNGITNIITKNIKHFEIIEGIEVIKY